MLLQFFNYSNQLWFLIYSSHFKCSMVTICKFLELAFEHVQHNYRVMFCLFASLASYSFSMLFFFFLSLIESRFCFIYWNLLPFQLLIDPFQILLSLSLKFFLFEICFMNIKFSFLNSLFVRITFDRQSSHFQFAVRAVFLAYQILENVIWTSHFGEIRRVRQGNSGRIFP